MKLNIRVIPRSSESKVVGEMANGTLKVKLTTPPIDGKANEDLIKILAKHFKVSKSSIKILKGKTSKNKIIEIKN